MTMKEFLLFVVKPMTEKMERSSKKDERKMGWRKWLSRSSGHRLAQWFAKAIFSLFVWHVCRCNIVSTAKEICAEDLTREHRTCAHATYRLHQFIPYRRCACKTSCVHLENLCFLYAFYCNSLQIHLHQIQDSMFSIPYEETIEFSITIRKTNKKHTAKQSCTRDEKINENSNVKSDDTIM